MTDDTESAFPPPRAAAALGSGRGRPRPLVPARLPGPRPEPEDGTPLRAARASALVVDDSPAGRALLGALLDGFGLASEMVATGVEALARILARRPDVVLLDLSAAGAEGGQTARRLRHLLGPAAPPVIALGSAGGLEAGPFAAVVAKPFTPRELYAALTAVLEPNPATRR